MIHRSRELDLTTCSYLSPPIVHLFIHFLLPIHKKVKNTELVIPHICGKLCLQNRGLIIGYYDPSCFIWIKSNKNTINLSWKVTDVGLGALAGPHRCFGGISYFIFAPNHPKTTPNDDWIIHFYRNLDIRMNIGFMLLIIDQVKRGWQKLISMPTARFWNY